MFARRECDPVFEGVSRNIGERRTRESRSAMTSGDTTTSASCLRQKTRSHRTNHGGRNPDPGPPDQNTRARPSIQLPEFQWCEEGRPGGEVLPQTQSALSDWSATGPWTLSGACVKGAKESLVRPVRGRHFGASVMGRKHSGFCAPVPWCLFPRLRPPRHSFPQLHISKV